MSRSPFRAGFAALLCTVLASAAHASNGDTTDASMALRAANPDMLSGGLFSALDAAGAFGARPVPTIAVRTCMADLSKGKPPAVLDGRVGRNIRIGDDPGALPATQLGQAEPHIYRSSTNPDLLLATFQEGRYTDAGSLDCGYGVSTDGGYTWTRALIPQLTSTSGGTYNRATDPVAAIGPQGDLYLNTLASITGAFSTAAIVVSRSTDNGATWSAPMTVFQSTTSQASPDKNWLAVNDYAGAPNSGRMVVTWTNFTSSASGAATGNNILAAYSDDRGATWSNPVSVTPTGAVNQGSQPVFLPDGSLAVIYVTFPNPATTSQFYIECKRSTDGGRSFPTTSVTAVPTVASWDDPDLRDGVFLPSATVARTSGDIFVTYTAVVSGTPRVLVAKSSDLGATWSTPTIASDNPSGSSVVNPAVAVTSDGKKVSVAFMDKRNASDGHNFIDLYAAQSFDGGATWQPNVRVSDMTSDIRHATSTTRGYMLGDYLGMAPSPGLDPVTGVWQPCVAIWCDARTGDADPFVARLTPDANVTYAAWAFAHGASGQPGSDDDSDTESNLLEFGNGNEPRIAETGDDLVVSHPAPGYLDVTWTQRPTNIEPRIRGAVAAINPDLSKFIRGAGAQVGATFVLAPGTPLTADQLPTNPPRSGLVWAGTRFTVPSGSMVAIARTVEFTHGAGAVIDGPVVTSGTDSRLVDVSTRGYVGTGSAQLIVGFVVDGSKTVLLRAAGPALANFGVDGVLQYPQLSLSASGATTSSLATAATTSRSADTAARVGAFPFPAGSADTAMLQTVATGGYTAIVSGLNGGTGVALAEAYDADPMPGASTGPRIVNLSTRGSVGPTSGPLIAGFVISGSQPRRVLIRAVGPTLASFAVTNAITDPSLTVNSIGPGGRFIASNDDWELNRSGAAIAATAQRLGAFPLSPASLDAALLLTLPPGGYTATVTGANGTSGVALVEVYDAD